MRSEAFERVTRYDGFLTMFLGVIPKPQGKTSLVSKDYAALWILPGSNGTGIAANVPVSLAVHMETTAKRETALAFP